MGRDAGNASRGRTGYLIARVAHDEAARWPTPRIDKPAEFLRDFMATSGRSQGDLAALLGSKSRASEILNGKRDFTVDQIRLLRRRWGIPADCLIGDLQVV